VILALLGLMRPRQWTKNLLVFAGLLFTIGQRHAAGDFLRVLFAFGLFCAASGAVYILNDTLDAGSDRRHPVKRKRPIASGLVPIPTALTFAAGLVVVSLGGGFLMGGRLGLILAGYLVLTTAYSLKLKHLVIVDLLALAAGYVIRAVAGAVVINVAISEWLLLCTTLLALFLGLAKRRHEIVILEDGAASHRRILDEYSVEFLDQMINITAATALMAYSLYTFAPFSATAKQHPRMMITIPFVIYGIFRYLYLIHAKNAGGHPEQVFLDDKPLLVNMVLWAGAVALVLMYG